ncbi:MAG: ribonuclease ribonuclease [Candidatus Parcubacteria bacterium]|jgi:ribonuclease HII
MSIKYIVGIDEVGRGPIAGPVTLCACCVTSDFDMKWFEGIKDSKKLSEMKREEWFKKAESARVQNLMEWVVVSKTAVEIDSRGIAVVIREALKECLEGLKKNPVEIKIFLDGSLFAPANYTQQETIIKGDEKVPLIGIASIIAKVTRDRYMDEVGKDHPGYGFENHKGYGTDKHYKAIKAFGMLPLHRKSFLKNI